MGLPAPQSCTKVSDGLTIGMPGLPPFLTPTARSKATSNRLVISSRLASGTFSCGTLFFSPNTGDDTAHRHIQNRGRRNEVRRFRRATCRCRRGDNELIEDRVGNPAVFDECRSRTDGPCTARLCEPRLLQLGAIVGHP